MSVPGLAQAVSNLYQDFSGALTGAGWAFAIAQAIWGRIRNQWIFRDKATLANERDLALKRAALDRQDAEICRREAELAKREAAMANHRAEVAEETVAALNTSIASLQDALTARIEGLEHKTFIQTRFIRDLMACITAGTPMPEVPEELRDDVGP